MASETVNVLGPSNIINVFLRSGARVEAAGRSDARRLPRTRGEGSRRLADKDVCYAPVLDLHEAWQRLAERNNGMVLKGGDGVDNVGTPIRFRREPGEPQLRFAEQGADTGRILQWLGYDATAVAGLRERKVV